MTTISPISSDHQSAQGSWSTQPLAVTVPPDALPYVTSSHSALRGNIRTIDYFQVALLVIFAVLNAGDLVTTYLGLAHGLNEGNPLMSRLLAHFGFAALIADKLLVIAAVTSGSLLLHKLDWRIAHAIALVCDALIFLVVISNIVQYLMIK